MKSKILITPLAALLAISVALTLTARADNLQVEAQQAIAKFLNQDPSLKSFFDKSVGYVVFPSVGKGGFIVGGARGQGVVYSKGQVIGTATMTQASVGAQAGGQTFAEIIFFETPEALENFKAGKFEMSADASAVVASNGASATARYSHGVAVFTMPIKGLMAQASVGGQKFKFESLAPK
jgi:lipid-binding SYLF domain-containing protein